MNDTADRKLNDAVKGRKRNLDLKSLDLIRIPDLIGDAENIRKIDLSDNSLEALPDSICRLKKLKVLKLNNNNFKQFPMQILSLNKLEELYISKNYLECIPAELFYLENLKIIDLSYNNISNIIDKQYRPSSISSINLSYNNLSEFPAILEKLVGIEEIKLNNNKISEIPDFIDKFENLKRIYLNDNKIKKINSKVANITDLEELFIQNNKFSLVPEELRKLKNIKKMILTNKQKIAIPLVLNLKPYDVFISHASEDKSTIAEPLAEILESLKIKVWLDKNELRLGDSIHAGINAGLKESGFGIVIISPSYIKKSWTNRELDALINMEENANKKILPILHNLEIEELKENYPLLINKLSCSSKYGLYYLANKILESILFDYNQFKKLVRVTDILAENIETGNINRISELVYAKPSIIYKLFRENGGDIKIIYNEGYVNLYFETRDSLGRIYINCLVLLPVKTRNIELINKAIDDAYELLYKKNIVTPAYNGYEYVNMKELYTTMKFLVFSGRRATLSEDTIEDINNIIYSKSKGNLSIEVRTYDYLIDQSSKLELSQQYDNIILK